MRDEKTMVAGEKPDADKHSFSNNFQLMEELNKTLTALTKINPNGTVIVRNILTQSDEEAGIN